MAFRRALLLDTHAAIWLVEGQLQDAVVEQIVFAGLADGVFVSPISAWEIGLLSRPRRNGRPKVSFEPDPQTWLATLIAKPIIKEAPLIPSTAIQSSLLPGAFHGDPADRLLVATARSMNVAIMTRDEKILDYAASGHVAAVSC